MTDSHWVWQSSPTLASQSSTPPPLKELWDSSVVSSDRRFLRWRGDSSGIWDTALAVEETDLEDLGYPCLLVFKLFLANIQNSVPILASHTQCHCTSLTVAAPFSSPLLSLLSWWSLYSPHSPPLEFVYMCIYRSGFCKWEKYVTFVICGPSSFSLNVFSPTIRNLHLT